MELKPSHFTSKPWDSVLQTSESEVIARNIMVISKRLGDNWGLTWDQYKAEREKDGHFTMSEKRYFDQVQPYVNSAEGAQKFSKTWRDAAKQAQTVA